MSREIEIYVADLAAYNNGKLRGVWIDATDNIENIYDQINKMLSKSPECFADEYAIHSYAGFGSYRLDEYQSIESVREMALFIQKYSNLGSELLNYFDLEDAKKAIEENYAGRYQSLAEFTEELTENTTQIPEHLIYYIDYEHMGRDMEINGDIYTIETGFEEVHVFWRH